MTEEIIVLDPEQPTTCPKCGSRTEFVEITGRLQRHYCPSCGHEFKGEVPLEPMSFGQAIYEMMDYIENDVYTVEAANVDNDPETAEYIEKMRLAINTAAKWLDENQQFFDVVPEGVELP